MAKGKGGGKGGYKLPGMRGALKTINQLGNQMHAEADADYAVALSGSQAGQRGLASQTRGLRRDLLRGSRADSRSLSKLARRARAQTGVVQGKVKGTTKQYGSALGQSIAQSYGPAKATAAGTGKVLTSAAKAGKKTTKIGKTVAGIAEAGVRAQAQAAKYSLNQALQQRAIIDNQTLAALTGDLYKTALSYNMEMMMFEKQQEAAAKAAKKEAAAATQQATAWLGTKGGEMGAWLQEAQETNAYVDEETGEFSVQKALAAYQTEYALNPEVNPNDANVLAVMSAALGKMKDGMGSSEAMVAASNELYGGLPGWNKVAPHLLGGIESSIAARTESRALSNLQGLEGLSLQTGGVEPTTTQWRDESAAAIRAEFGESTARAWLRGQTDWTDEHIDIYLDLLPEPVGTLQYGTGAANTGTSTYQPVRSGGSAGPNYGG